MSGWSDHGKYSLHEREIRRITLNHCLAGHTQRQQWRQREFKVGGRALWADCPPAWLKRIGGVLKPNEIGFRLSERWATNIGLLYPKVRHNIGGYSRWRPPTKILGWCVPGIPGGVDASERQHVINYRESRRMNADIHSTRGDDDDRCPDFRPSDICLLEHACMGWCRRGARDWEIFCRLCLPIKLSKGQRQMMKMMQAIVPNNCDYSRPR